MTPTPFQKRLLLKLVIAGGLIALLSLAVIVINNNLNSRVAEIDNQKAEIVTRSRTIDLIAGGSNDLKRAEPMLARLHALIPPKAQLFTFKNEALRRGKDFGVSVGFEWKDGEVAPTEAEAGAEPFQLAVAGPYDNVVAYLHELEQHPYFVRFESVTSMDYTKEDKLYNLIISGFVYFF